MDEKYQWPEDKEFQLFARLLADKVTVFINTPGKKIVTGPKFNLRNDEFENCPIGAINGKFFPYALENIQIPGVDVWNVKNFIDAFDGTEFSIASGPYTELGRAYRERFGYGNS